MTVVADDIIRVTAKMEVVANANQNVWHAKITGGPATDAEVVTAFANGMNEIYNSLVGYMQTSSVFVSIAIWNVTQDRPLGDVPWPTLTTGGSASANSAYQLAPLVKFNTLVARSQGRKYIPVRTVDAYEGGGIITAGELANLAAFASDALAFVDFGVWGYKFGNWNKNLMRFAPWDSAVIDDRVKTQRRRYLGSGI